MDFNGDKRSAYVCVYCSAPATDTYPLQRCGGCQLVAYCSKSCQKQDRAYHKALCKAFPVVDGVNVLHTTGSFIEHLAHLRKQAAKRLPDHYIKVYVDNNRIFHDPKVCSVCHESRPDVITICKCSHVGWCSKKCSRADKVHKKYCSLLANRRDDFCLRFIRASYPMSLFHALELLSNEYRPSHDSIDYSVLTKLKVHVVTNSTYFDAKAWEVGFHETYYKKNVLRQLKLVFIIQDETPIPLLKRKEKFTEEICDICVNKTPQDRIQHQITSTFHQKPYHMYFASPEYSEPDIVIVYGVTGMNSETYCDISYSNMTYSHSSVLILTDATEDLVAQGAQAVNAARPVDELIPPHINRGKNFGTYRTHAGIESSGYFDFSGTNEKYYLTCLRRK